MNFIEELYYGNIKPDERQYKPSTEYARFIRDLVDVEEKLMKELSEENLKLFNDFIKVNDEIRAVNDIENFKTGFRLGVQMMCDCLLPDKDRVFRSIGDRE